MLLDTNSENLAAAAILGKGLADKVESLSLLEKPYLGGFKDDPDLPFNYAVALIAFCTKHSKLNELECLLNAKEILMGVEVKGQKETALANAWQRFFRRLKLSKKEDDFKKFIDCIQRDEVDPVVRKAYLDVVREESD